MTICSKRSLLNIIPALALLTFGACTEVDDTLGSEFIPEDQQMEVDITSLGTAAADPNFIETRLVQKDSIRTNRTGYIHLGGINDSDFGHTTASAIIQPVPIQSATKDNYFGTGAEVDSIFLSLDVVAVGGKTGTVQDFTIYELKRPLSRYGLYYADFYKEIDDYVDLSKPLFKFRHAGTGSIDLKLDYANEDDAEEYMNRLMDATTAYLATTATGSLYERDSIFIDGNGGTVAGMNGLYILPDVAKSDAGIYTVAADYYAGYASSLTLYTSRPTTDEEKEENEDLGDFKVVGMGYAFSDVSLSGSSYSANAYYSSTLNCFHRYYEEGTLSAQINSVNIASTTWVQGMNGVYTELKFTEALGAKLTELKKGKNMAVSSAMLYVEVADPRPPLLSAAFTTLGMFDKYSDSYKKDAQGNYVTDSYGDKIVVPKTLSPDYYVDYYNSSSTTYGGVLDNSAGAYKMNITTAVQRMVSGKIKFPYKVSLAPDVNSTFLTNQVALKGTGFEPGYQIKLKIKYALIP